MGFVPAGAFAVAGLAAAAGIRWALIGPGLLITACAAGILAVRLFSERPAAGFARQATAHQRRQLTEPVPPWFQSLDPSPGAKSPDPAR